MFLNVNGARLFVDTAGTSIAWRDGVWQDRPTIVAIHGGPGMDCGYLVPYFAGLLEDAQILFIDLRGSGRSERVDTETLTLDLWADDVIAVVDALGIERPILFGHSFGGFVAMNAAIRAPGRWGGMIPCNTIAATTEYDNSDGPSLEKRGSPEAKTAAARFWGGDHSEEAMAEYLRLTFPFYFGPGHEHLAEDVRPLSGMVDEVSTHWFTELSSSYDLRPQLTALPVPTLVLVGDYDWVCSPAAARDIATHIPGAELQVISGAGHFPFVEEPDAFSLAIRTFLRDRVTQ